MKKSRMFRLIVESEGKTWTPVPGCTHKCPYFCWAMDLIAPWVGANRNCDKCRSGIPHTHFEMSVPKAKVIFVDSWGDLFCRGMKDEWIERVIEIGPWSHPETDFLFCTKNTPRYSDFLDLFSENCILGCYDEKTRAVTTDGIKNFKEINSKDKVLSINPKTSKLEVKPVERVLAKNYEGEMVHFEGKRLNLMVTPNHRMLIELPWRKVKHPFTFERARETSRRSRFHLPKVRAETGKSKKNDKSKWLYYLVGIYIGDGWLERKKIERIRKTGLNRQEYLKWKKRFHSNPPPNPQPVTYKACRTILCIPKSDRCRPRVERALKELGVKYSRYEKEIYTSSRELTRIFESCGKGAKNKHIPRTFLDSNDYFLLRRLLQGILDSDGYDNRRITTTSQDLVRDVVEIATKLGYHTTVSKRFRRSIYEKRVIEGNSFDISLSRSSMNVYKKNIHFDHYSGKIWCPVVRDNQNLLVERKGKFAFCGNSTIESNRDEIYPKSNAPPPSKRHEALKELDWPRKFFSAEPLIDFDLDTFLEWIISVDPEYCEIGYDNYASRTLKKMGSYLPEPSQSKTNKLIEEKEKAGIDTHRKSIRKACWEGADKVKPQNKKSQMFGSITDT